MYSREPKFQYFQYEQLTKDICYNKPFSMHIKTTRRDSSCQHEESVQVKSGKCFLTGSTKMSHNIGNKIVQATLANSSIKLYYGYKLKKQDQNAVKYGENHVNTQPKGQQQSIPQKTVLDTQIQQQDNQSTILYSRLYTDRKFHNASIQLGVSRSSPRLEIDTNLAAVLYQRQTEYFFYGKALFKGKWWSAGAISLFDYGCRNLQTNNLVLEVIPHKKHRFFLRGEVDGLRNYSLKYSKIGNYFDYFIMNYVGRPTDTLAIMAEYRYDCNTRKTKTVQGMMEKRFDKNTLRCGINQLADVTFQMSFPFPLSIGHGSRLDFGIQVADFLAGRRIRYGLRANIEA